MIQKQRYVFLTFTQRRNVEYMGSQPLIQVETEFTILHIIDKFDI